MYCTFADPKNINVNLLTAMIIIPDDEEGDEVYVGEVGAAAFRVAGVLALLVANDVGALKRKDY